MLPKKHRLNFIEFNFNTHQAKKYFSPFLTIVKKRGRNNITRAGIIVAKSVDKRSTKRNYSRRIVSEIIQKNINLMKEPTDMLIRLKKIVNKENRREFEEELLKYLKHD